MFGIAMAECRSGFCATGWIVFLNRLGIIYCEYIGNFGVLP